MGLLFSMHLNRRENELHLYSFRGLDEIILTQLKHSQSVLNYNLIFHELTPGKAEIIMEDESLSVETIPLSHKISCSGFLFREKPKPRKINKENLPPGILLQHIALLKKGEDVYQDDGALLYRNADFTLDGRPSLAYAYCSDTAYLPEVVEQIKGVDLLYHEATFMEAEKDKAKETKHCTASEAARIAQAANARKLIIGHFSARYRELDELLKEAQTIFPDTALAIEYTTFDVTA